MQRPENPFGSRFTRPGQLPFLSADDCPFEKVVAMIEQEPRSAIVGPHGSGKTTLVEHACLALHAKSAFGIQRIVLRIGRSRTELWSLSEKMRPADLLVVDGYEQLGWFSRIRLWLKSRRSGFRLLITSHAACRGYRTIASLRGDREVAVELARRLTEPHREFQAKMLVEFPGYWDRAGGDVRQLWADMYDRFEEDFANLD